MQDSITEYRDLLSERKFEIIDGQLIIQARLPHRNHGRVESNVYRMFDKYFMGRKCRVYKDDTHIRLDIIEKTTDIKLPDKNKKDRYRPDIMVVCDRTIDTPDGIVGAPDLVIEIVSLSSMIYDREIKKKVYELIGVKEYWIIHHIEKSIEIYLLKDGKYVLSAVYGKLKEAPDEILEIFLGGKIEDSELKEEFSPFSFPDLIIKIDDVFEDMFE